MPDEGSKSGPENPYNPLYHEFVCVVIDGVTICGGQDRSGGPYSPGKATSDDSMSNGQCKMVEPDNRCVETCELKKIYSNRPYYGVVGPGTSCQEWAEDTVRDCKKICTTQ